jgi:hypothetical protein
LPQQRRLHGMLPLLPNEGMLLQLLLEGLLLLGLLRHLLRAALKAAQAASNCCA